MGITTDDIRSQREMLERGEKLRDVADAAAEQKRLRDQFAAAALTGLLAAETSGSLTDDLRAEYAYKAADAMLRARG